MEILHVYVLINMKLPSNQKMYSVAAAKQAKGDQTSAHCPILLLSHAAHAAAVASVLMLNELIQIA